MATEDDNQLDDVVPIKLSAPSGWHKKLSPKQGGTPQRKDIVFISPTGEEIKNKRQLDQYLKSHPGGPAASEFDWGTGDTPRRSARLSEKTKTDGTPASMSPKKRQKVSRTKGVQEKSNTDAEEKEETTDERDAAAVEAKATVQDSTVDAKYAIDEDVIPGKLKSEDAEKMTTDTQVALKEPSATAPVDNEIENFTLPQVCSVKVDESQGASQVVPDSKNDETKEATNAGKETPDEKVESALAASDDPDNSKGKKAEEKDVEKDLLLQEPTTGS